MKQKSFAEVDWTGLLPGRIAPAMVEGGAVRLVSYMAGITSTLGVLIAAVNSQSRLIFNAGREGLLPRWLGKVHPQRRTPVNAIFAFVIINRLTD